LLDAPENVVGDRVVQLKERAAFALEERLFMDCRHGRHRGLGVL
jgi:hypothetical protein